MAKEHLGEGKHICTMCKYSLRQVNLCARTLYITGNSNKNSSNRLY